MSEGRTPYGRAMLDLVERLGRLADRPFEDDEERVTFAFCELASTPFLWPLDDVWLEALLTWAGFRLDDADDAELALGVVGTLLEADPECAAYHCGHGEEPSHFCAMFDEADLSDIYDGAAANRAEGVFDAVYAIRRQRLRDYGGPSPAVPDLPS